MTSSQTTTPNDAPNGVPIDSPGIASSGTTPNRTLLDDYRDRLTYTRTLHLLTEEAGWRGALLPRLQTRLTPLTASLVLGAVWTVWHLPSLHVPGETDQGLSLPVFAVLVVATTVLITALVNAAGGSVLIAAIFHASFDAAYAYTGVVGGDPTLLQIATALTVAAAAAVVVRTRGRLCAPPR